MLQIAIHISSSRSGWILRFELNQSPLNSALPTSLVVPPRQATSNSELRTPHFELQTHPVAFRLL
jgi:hypothetical protein